MHPLNRIATYALLLAGALGSTYLHAAEPRYNQVSLRAEASHEVPHDLMSVTLYTEAQSDDPAKLSADITRTLNSALEKIRAVDSVQVRIGGRSSQPVYGNDSKSITAWRERGELNLESTDFATLSKLTGNMLQTLKMSNMTLSIAADTRKKHEDALFEEAIKAFQARSELVTKAMSGKGYKVVNLNLNTGGYHPPVVLRAYAASNDMLMKSSAPAPEIATGTSRVTIQADGVIEVR